MGAEVAIIGSALGILGGITQAQERHQARVDQYRHQQQQYLYQRRAAEAQAQDLERYATRLRQRASEDVEDIGTEREDLRRERRQALASLTAQMAARGGGFRQQVYSSHEGAYDRGDRRLRETAWRIQQAANAEVRSTLQRAHNARELARLLPQPGGPPSRAGMFGEMFSAIGGGFGGLAPYL